MRGRLTYSSSEGRVQVRGRVTGRGRGRVEHRLPPTKLTLTLTLILTLNPKPYQALESLDWVERVERRWELRQHSPYAHLAQDGRLAASDALVDLSFVGPASALATVQLGFPPLMYTEVRST